VISAGFLYCCAGSGEWYALVWSVLAAGECRPVGGAKAERVGFLGADQSRAGCIGPGRGVLLHAAAAAAPARRRPLARSVNTHPVVGIRSAPESPLIRKQIRRTAGFIAGDATRLASLDTPDGSVLPGIGANLKDWRRRMLSMCYSHVRGVGLISMDTCAE
jgi:hypothetical protein